METKKTKSKKTEAAPATDIPAGPPATSVKQAGIYRIDVDPTLDEPKAPRENSKRRAVLDAMRNGGATVDEVMEITAKEPYRSQGTGPWNRRTAQEGIRLLNKQNGFGLRTDADGKIHAYTKAEAASAKKSA